MKNNDMEHTWKNSAKGSPDGDEAELLRAVASLIKRTQRRNLLTVGAFVLVILAMAYFVTQMQFHDPLTFVGIGLAGCAMLFMLVMKWFRQQGLSRFDMNTAAVEFLRIVRRRLRFSGWLIAYGVLIYSALFALGFVLTLPEMLAGLSSGVQFLASSIGIAYLMFITIRGRMRAKREYEREVKPVIDRVEALLGQLD
jgi:hypothetical protein